MSGTLNNTLKKHAFVGSVGAVAVTALVAFSLPALAGHGHKSERHKEHMQMVDTNGDGKISKEEAEAARSKRFEAIDTNGDGVVSYEEYEEMIRKRRAERHKRRFERRDKNGDGVLSPDELGRGAEHFDKVDLNGDGEITEEERKAAHEKMRKHRRHRHHHEGKGGE